MARAAVIPQSPAKRAGRPSTKSTAATDAKKKAPRKATPAPRTAPPALDTEDDSDDELGMITSKPTKPTGRPPGQPATKPKTTTATRGKKAATAPESRNDDKPELGQQSEAPKKRVGRPRKNPPPNEPVAPKTELVSKPRGRPRAGTTAKATATRETAASSRRTRAAADTTTETKPNTIKIATNSTTMRSNLLRGPAKKKTVKFQDVSDIEAQDSEPEVPAAGRRRVTTKDAGAGKTGLRATPVRKPAASTTRGRKPAATKKNAPQPLSPKKAKQVAKTLSSYASSDGEDDELVTIKDNGKDPVKLVVHSPVKHGLEATGLSSPVRRINFTPKKATSFVDENGEPKLPSPQHGSEGVGLNSPVRKINFTPNRNQKPVADNGHLALPPGNSVIFSDSMIMSSPARRPPQSSPFRFSLRETSNRGGSVFQDNANPQSAPEFTPGCTSPLKMSPKKGLLSASFSQSSLKASTSAAPARTPLFQSPAKRIASPFKSSIFSAHTSISRPESTENDGTPSKSVEMDRTTTPQSSPRESQFNDADFQKDTEMVEDVARDIFGIELSSEGKASSNSSKQEVDYTAEDDNASDSEVELLRGEVETEAGVESDLDLEEDESAQLCSQDEELETVCFDIMEDANMGQQDYDCQEPQEGSGSEAGEDTVDLEEHAQFEYEEADTICFDVLEDANMEQQGFDDQQSQEDSEPEEDEFTKDEQELESEEFETICFDTMEEAHLADDEICEPEGQTADAVMEDANNSEERLAELDYELEAEELRNVTTGTQHRASTTGPEMRDETPEQEAREPRSPSGSPFKFAYKDESQSPFASGHPVESEHEAQDAALHHENGDHAMSDDSEVEDIELTPMRAELLTLPYQPNSPHESNHVTDVASPLSGKPATVSPLPSPTAGGSTPLFLNRPDNIENDIGSTLDAKNANNVNIDTPLHEENSSTPSTLIDSPVLTTPSFFNTPSLADQNQSVTENSLGFTPLAQKFSRWEQDTPSQARSLRPRRRGVFSLVGPLERTNTDTPKASGGVSYPDLSKSPLLNTPSLFAELPLQPQSDLSCMSQELEQTPRQCSTHEDDQMINQPGQSIEIFEDPDLRPNDLEHTLASEAPQEQDKASDFIEDKENCGPSNPPLTPMKAQSDVLRTIHTVSKVPLRAEGDVSPFKLPRKRGLSLSSTSPTRSSPRVRKPTFMAIKDNATILSPTRRSSQTRRSPTPKRRSTSARRSSGKPPVMAALGDSVATASPAKKPRRSMSTEQKALHGAVVHVDVHTTEGEDASGIFVELLQQMGARCVKSWSWNPSSSLSTVDGAEPKDLRVGITHVVYKDGGLRTLEKVKKAAGLVKCVGVGWVLDCEREKQWLDETPYAVDSSIVPRGGAKRRKSMEPRALSNVNGTLVRVSESPAPAAGRRRSGVNPGAVEGFRKITPPTHKQQTPATPPHQSSADSYQFPATPGYNFANLDAIGMSPATPAFLGNRSKLVQQSCPPKQTNRGLFPSAKPMGRLSDEGDDEESRRQRRFRMEAARRKSLVYKPAVGSPLVP